MLPLLLLLLLLLPLLLMLLLLNLDCKYVVKQLDLVHASDQS